MIYKAFQNIPEALKPTEALKPVEAFANIPKALDGEIYVPPVEPEPE